MWLLFDICFCNFTIYECLLAFVNVFIYFKHTFSLLSIYLAVFQKMVYNKYLRRLMCVPLGHASIVKEHPVSYRFDQSLWVAAITDAAAATADDIINIVGNFRGREFWGFVFAKVLSTNWRVWHLLAATPASTNLPCLYTLWHVLPTLQTCDVREVVCQVGKHQHQLAYWCSLCENFNA